MRQLRPRVDEQTRRRAASRDRRCLVTSATVAPRVAVVGWAIHAARGGGSMRRLSDEVNYEVLEGDDDQEVESNQAHNDDD